jgi:hypothetical protein
MYRSAAQVIRVKEPLPADYMGSVVVQSPAPAAVLIPDPVKPSAKSLMESFFGSDVGEDQKNGRGGNDESTALVGTSYSYHDERFIKVLDSCGGSMSSSCKKKLLQAYQVGIIMINSNSLLCLYMCWPKCVVRVYS